MRPKLFIILTFFCIANSTAQFGFQLNFDIEYNYEPEFPDSLSIKKCTVTTCEPGGIKEKCEHSEISYNRSGNVTSEVKFDTRQKEVEKTNSIYNEKNKLMTYEEYDDGDLEKREIYSYDKNYNLIEKKEFDDNNKLENKIVFIYDDKYGVLQKSITYDKKKK